MVDASEGRAVEYERRASAAEAKAAAASIRADKAEADHTLAVDLEVAQLRDELRRADNALEAERSRVAELRARGSEAAQYRRVASNRMPFPCAVDGTCDRLLVVAVR
jgi:hypothetical protein